MRLAALTVLALAACAHTPQEVVDMGERRTYPIKLAAEQSIACMQTNAENWGSNVLADRRGNRLIVRLLGDFPTTVAVVDLQPKTATVHLWQNLAIKDKFFAWLTEGC